MSKDSGGTSESDAPAALLAYRGRPARSAVADQPLPELPTVPARRPAPFGWQLAAGVLAVVLAAAIAVGLPRMLGKDPVPTGSSNAAPTTSADPSSVTSPDPSSTASAGPGLQVITFHGLSITVPASWKVSPDYNPCKVTTSIVELMVGGAPACYQPADPDLTRVQFFARADLLPLSDVRRASHTTISGLAATREEGFSSGGRAGFGYVVPELHAAVLIWPARGQTGQELSDSLRVDAVDKHGCRSRATAAEVAEFPGSATSDRAGMAQALIPGRPESASVCRYRAGWLEQGARISGPDLDAFTATVDELPPGLSRAVQRSTGTCREPGTLGSLDDDEMHADLDAYRIEVRYPDGQPVVLIARLGECRDLGISNGARTGQRTDELLTWLLRLAGAGTALPGAVRLAP